VVLGGILLENGLWEEANGFVTCPALLALAPLALLAGYVRYVRKEGVSRPAPLQSSDRVWLWLIISTVVLLFFMLMWTGVRKAPAPMKSDPPRMEVEYPPPLPPSTPGGGDTR
jgi:hypothetical protein